MVRALALASIIALAATAPVSIAEAKQEYSYDSQGRLVRVVHPNGLVTSYTYDAANNRLQRARGAGGGGPPPAPAAFAQDDSAFVPTNSNANLIQVLTNDSGSGLTVIAVSNVTDGGAGIASGGQGVFYSPPWYPGPQSLVYTIQDSLGRTSSATVYIDVYELTEDPCNTGGNVPCEVQP